MASRDPTGEIALTVAIATRNRRDLVVAALESVIDQLDPADELLVVDTGSTDDTAGAVEAWLAAHAPRGRLLSDPGAGVSQARNTLLREASAPYVCFLDDDARAEPGWLDAARRAWGTASERTAVLGGPIAPDWGAPRPDWLPDYLLFILSVLDLGPGRLLLDQTPGRGFAWGGNMAVRVEPALEVGGFDVGVGARPAKPMGRGEDQDLQLRLAARGYETWYEPALATRHHIPPERLSEEYFAAQLRVRASEELADAGGRARALVRFLRLAARYVVAHVAGGRAARTTARLELIYGWNLLRAPAARR